MKNLYVIVALIIATGPPVKSQEHEETRREIEKIIFYDTEIDFSIQPGFIVGIVDYDSTIILGFGNTADNPSSIPEKSLLYELGGLSKIFTAWLVRLLTMEELLSPDDPVNKHLPISHQNHLLDTIKLIHLITHTSRLPKLPALMEYTASDSENRYAFFSKESVLDSWAALEAKDLSSISYLYSHFNYALLEIIIERVTSIPFEEALRNRIWTPLQMNRTTIHPDERELQYLAPGYDRAGRKTAPWKFDSFAGSEGIKSSPEDLCLFLSYVLNHPESQISQAFYSLLQPHSHIPGTKKSYVAEAWHLFQNKSNYPIYLHSGRTSGHGSMITFIPQTRTAVVILSKSTHTLNGLGTLILRMINYNWKRKYNDQEN